MARRLILGLDGMPGGLFRILTDDGTMPALARLRQQGVLRDLQSSLPSVSSVAWSSIITGTGPGTHGIYGFSDFAPDSYRVIYPNYRALRALPFWEQQPVLRCAIINVPATYPVRPMTGVHIAGFVALDLEQAVHPPVLLPELQALAYKVDADAGRAADSPAAFMAEVLRVHRARLAAMRRLWAAEAWDVFMLVFTGTDRIFHYLWPAVTDAAHPCHASIIDYFRELDAGCGELLDTLTADDEVLVLSDHGFGPLQVECNINILLRQRGYLHYSESLPRALNQLADGTTAFALDPGRIYLHRAGRFPRGTVTATEAEPLLSRLRDELLALRWQGQPVSAAVERGDSAYRGPAAALAPDLVAVPAPGAELRARLAGDEALTPAGRFAGCHTEKAMLLYRGQATVPDTVSVATVLQLLRLTEEES